MRDLVVEGLLRGHRLREGAFAQREDLTEVSLPETVEDIGEVAFYGCPNLRTIRLPRSLKFIREEAFGESGLEEVVIPAGVREIGEKAFFSCEKLRRIEVLGSDTRIGKDAFGSCPELKEGYVACGYPEDPNPPEELLFTLLWCSCPERHREDTSRRARDYVRKNEGLIMEHIFKSGNAAALSGIVREGLLRGENIGRYVEKAGRSRQTELVTLLLTAAREEDEDDFSL